MLTFSEANNNPREIDEVLTPKIKTGHSLPHNKTEQIIEQNVFPLSAFFNISPVSLNPSRAKNLPPKHESVIFQHFSFLVHHTTTMRRRDSGIFADTSTLHTNDTTE
jgi:hypothetical protein